VKDMANHEFHFLIKFAIYVLQTCIACAYLFPQQLLYGSFNAKLSQFKSLYCMNCVVVLRLCFA